MSQSMYLVKRVSMVIGLPNFAIMSRRPGIGSNFVSKIPKKNYIYLNGYKKRLPRYYKDKLFTKEQKIYMREQTQIHVKRLYERELARLSAEGYAHPFAEYEQRQKFAATKKQRDLNYLKRKF